MRKILVFALITLILLSTQVSNVFAVTERKSVKVTLVNLVCKGENDPGSEIEITGNIGVTVDGTFRSLWLRSGSDTLDLSVDESSPVGTYFEFTVDTGGSIVLGGQMIEDDTFSADDDMSASTTVNYANIITGNKTVRFQESDQIVDVTFSIESTAVPYYVGTDSSYVIIQPGQFLECDKRINLVILGDGYTNNEQYKFSQDATRLATNLLNSPPYSSYKDFINVFVIQIISSQSGASQQPGLVEGNPGFVRNYFGTYFEAVGNDNNNRLLRYPWANQALINQAIQQYAPQCDQSIIIVNSDQYGGSGGYDHTLGTYANTAVVSSSNINSDEVLLHELGHAFADLRDEYWPGSQYAMEKDNMTQNTDPATVPWSRFIGYNGIGVYNYDTNDASAASWRRPSEDCKMETLNTPFCAVCTNAHINKIHSLLFEKEMTLKQTQPNASIVLKGDVNVDGVVNNQDLALLLAYVQNDPAAYNINLYAADLNISTDVNGDGIDDDVDNYNDYKVLIEYFDYIALLIQLQ